MSKKELYKAQNIQFLQELSTQEGINSLPCGIYYKVLQTGEGKSSPTVRSIVTVHYKGTLIDGKEFEIPISEVVPRLSVCAMSLMGGSSLFKGCM